MLIKEGESRTLKTDILLASSLAFVAGGVNSAGYLGFGYFSANMTGNVSLISDHISAGDLYLGVAFLGIVAMFMAERSLRRCSSKLATATGCRRYLP
ncbi:DUF1275 domain-containing protein [Rhizobium laguerreae]|nr:DUF1275 family protein [Rhizobium laguerreae]MBY3102270.1 DUF1275 domain-containing protein [Rhizobium laguerreae]